MFLNKWMQKNFLTCLWTKLKTKSKALNSNILLKIYLVVQFAMNSFAKFFFIYYHNYSGMPTL